MGILYRYCMCMSTVSILTIHLHAVYSGGKAGADPGFSERGSEYRGDL